MFSIEKMCKKISLIIARELNLSQDRLEVINYGVFGMIQTTIAIVAVIVAGIIFNVLIESLLISFVISLLRKSSGGVHASTPAKCAIIGAVVSVTIAKICKNINLEVWGVLVFSIIIFIWSIYIVDKLAPVDSVSKPIRKEKSRQRLKKNSIKILIIYILIIICNALFYYLSKDNNLIVYAWCICIGTAWQVFTLTQVGHFVIKKIDKLF